MRIGLAPTPVLPLARMPAPSARAAPEARLSPGLAAGGVGGHSFGRIAVHAAPPGVVQRSCDASVLARTRPVFFPEQRSLREVFDGTITLGPGNTRFAATGLVQQALVDLGFTLGTAGPNRDGVDRTYSTTTRDAVQQFQTREGLTGVSAGVVDQNTLKCLDEIRSHTVVQAHQLATVTERSLTVEGQNRGGRDEDIFFLRGSAVLDGNDEAKIDRIATANHGCPLALHGFLSEDERVDFGDRLASDRIQAVDDRLRAGGHDAASAACPSPPSPLRSAVPRPADSAGIARYRDRRKVEILTATATSRTAACPRGAPQIGTFAAGTEAPLVTTAIDDAVALLDNTRSQLTPGHAAGDPALTALFGGPTQRTAVRGNLLRWRNHLDRVVRRRIRRGTDCHPTCTPQTYGFNNDTGASAMMTICSVFFGGRPARFPGTTERQNRALDLIHEAGHGSIGTEDLAYDWMRLIEFLANTPRTALVNTDTYVTFVACLNGMLPSCTPAARADTPLGLSAAELRQAQEGTAWLDTWLEWTMQDTGGLSGAMARARPAGRWDPDDGYYSGSVFEELARAFQVRRPGMSALPTFREQTMVAAVLSRVSDMRGVLQGNLRLQKVTAPAVEMWSFGPGDRVDLLDTGYLALTARRARVERLLRMIVFANLEIPPAEEPMYVSYVEGLVRRNWGNRP